MRPTSVAYARSSDYGVRLGRGFDSPRLHLFIGHFAVGFAAKRAAPRTSLGLLIAAPAFLDILWPVFLALGWERVHIEPGNTAFTPLNFEWYPWSHSLLMSVVWGLVVGGIYWAIRRDKRGAVVLGLLVFSHWVLDFVTHRADMPIDPGGRVRVGLGLWNHPAATVVIESLLYAAGIWLYVRTTKALDRIGQWALAGFVLVLAAIYVGASFGPPPPDVKTIVVTSFGLWLFPVWAWWIDRHRGVVAPASTPGQL